MKTNNKNTYGQNFIFDENLLKSLLDYANVGSNDNILEIGAGMGTLTKQLAKSCKHVTSFEIDSSLMPYLNIISNEFDNLNIINMDFLKYDLYSLNYKDFKVIANIPYYITSEILYKLILNNLNIKQISIMVQLEVAKKMAAKPKSGDNYGYLSLLCQHRYETDIATIVEAECFTPPPNVDSAFINLKLKDEPFDENFDNYFYKFIKAAFLHRRKTLVNGVKSSMNIDIDILKKALEALEIKLNVRAEELDYNEMLKLTKYLYGELIK